METIICQKCSYAPLIELNKDNLKEKVYKKVPDNLKVESENVKISSTNYGNIVTIYLKSSVYLKYGK